MSLPLCPKCNSEYTYIDQELYTCPECAHEWPVNITQEPSNEISSVSDANGNRLHEGEFATLIKDLKVKGSSRILKIGTRIKVNSIVEGDHNIDCKVDKVGTMMLKSELVKKVSA
jgi:protein PhnA